MCPSAPAFPVAIAPADVNNDGDTDIVVFDPCGNWIVFGNGDNTFRAGKWEEALPPMLTLPYVDVFELQQGERMLFAATERSGQFVRLRHDARMQQLSWAQPWLPLGVPRGVTNLAVRVPALDSNAEESSLIVQGLARLDVFNVSGGDPTLVRNLTQTVEPPYSRPFDGIDHLAALALTGCKPLLLGVGRFFGSAAPPVLGAGAGPTQDLLTRNLQLYVLGDSQYTVSDFDRGLDVTTYAAVSRPRRADAIVGIVGARRPNSTVISIWRVVDCTRFELLVESEAEFAWRTPMQRIDDQGVQPIPKQGGVRMLGAIDEDENKLTFLHYDGYDLRIFSVVEQADGWHVVESKQALYAERTDLSSE